MKALSPLILALSTLVVMIFTSAAEAQQIPNFTGTYNVIPNQCNFVGIDNIQGAMVANTTDNTGAQIIVLTLVGTKQKGEIGFRTQRSRLPNPALATGSPIQWIDTDVTISQSVIAITNLIHDEYKDGHTEMEAQLSLELTEPQLKFISNEGSQLQAVCLFQRLK